MSTLRTASTFSNLAFSSSTSTRASAILRPSNINSISSIRFSSTLKNSSKSNSASISATLDSGRSVCFRSSSSTLISTRFITPKFTNSQLSPNFICRLSSTSSSQVPSSSRQGPSSTTPQSQSQPKTESEAESEEPDEPPPKASFRERMRFLSRRYGWWALAVYLLASLIDFSLIFAAIHFLGAEHIKEWENWAREKVGLQSIKKEKDQSLEDSTISISVPGSKTSLEMLNNSKAAKEALEMRKGSLLTSEDKISNSNQNGTSTVIDSGSNKKDGSHSNSSLLWTEAVLAYTIHKTLLLPFRVMFTAAVLPSFVKLMVKWGLSKPNYVVKNAAKKAHEAAARRKMAA